MSSWDEYILEDDTTVDFLDELAELADASSADLTEAIEDAIRLADGPHATLEEMRYGQVAATIAAIWAGAPFSAGEAADTYPFIREGIGTDVETVRDAAYGLLEPLGEHYDVEVFLEALS